MNELILMLISSYLELDEILNLLKLFNNYNFDIIIHNNLAFDYLKNLIICSNECEIINCSILSNTSTNFHDYPRKIVKLSLLLLAILAYLHKIEEFPGGGVGEGGGAGGRRWLRWWRAAAAAAVAHLIVFPIQRCHSRDVCVVR